MNACVTVADLKQIIKGFCIKRATIWVVPTHGRIAISIPKNINPLPLEYGLREFAPMTVHYSVTADLGFFSNRFRKIKVIELKCYIEFAGGEKIA
jgi:hypothetical protein